MGPWTPILSKSDGMAAAALKSVVAIANELLQQRYLQDRLQREHYRYEDSLLYAYLSCTIEDRQWERYCVEQLNAAIECMSNRDISLYGGLCGLGWTVEHISRLLVRAGCGSTCAIDKEEDDLGEDIDLEIIKQLQEKPRSYPFDLISGLVGFGVYFLERLPSVRAEQGLALIGEELVSTAEYDEGGISWLTEPHFVPAWQRSDFPLGHYDLGVAHGIPGILYLLSEMVIRGLQRKHAWHLLENGMRWLLSQSRTHSAPSRFPSCTSAVHGSRQARPVWCYGDLGVATVVLQIARSVDRSDWRSSARVLIDHCLDLKPDEYLVKDAGLCHGAAGIAHIFNRLYQMEGDQRYRAAALSWFQRTLDFCRPGTGFGGYSRFTIESSSKEVVWEPCPALLDGAIGIALSLLAAATSVEPTWDRLLLLSSGSPEAE